MTKANNLQKNVVDQEKKVMAKNQSQKEASVGQKKKNLKLFFVKTTTFQALPLTFEKEYERDYEESGFDSCCMPVLAFVWILSE